jgi:hypothetical protein
MHMAAKSYKRNSLIKDKIAKGVHEIMVAVRKKATQSKRQKLNKYIAICNPINDMEESIFLACIKLQYSLFSLPTMKTETVYQFALAKLDDIEKCK